MSFGVGLFLLLEMSARLYYFGGAGLVPARINSVHGLPQAGITQMSSEPDLGFELKPNLDSYFKLVPFRTNSRGLRDREYSIEKPPNTFRVAVLGASFTLPAGVEIERAFHSLLEAQLSEELAPKRYEFINFAVGMYHPRQVLAMLQLRALEYQPDLILVAATELSMPGLIEVPSSKPPPTETMEPPKKVVIPAFKKSYPILQSFFVRLIMERTGNGPSTSQLYVGTVEKYFMTLIERWRSPSAAKEKPVAKTRPAGRRPARHGSISVVQRLGNLQAETGIPIVLVRLEFDAAERQAIDLEVEAQARALGLHYLDTRDAFQGTRPNQFWIYELDPHPNAKAHEIFARVLATFLRSNELLPEEAPL